MSLRILSAADVDRITETFSPLDLQLLMAQVFHAVSSRGIRALGNATTDQDNMSAGGDSQWDSLDVQTPHRTLVETERHSVLFMPARLGGRADDVTRASPSDQEDEDGSTRMLSGGHGTSIKVVSVPKIPDPRGLPATTLVLDEQTGSPKAVVNSRKLTALRNAAGSLLSTALVATRYPKHIVAFGAGAQSRAHLELHVRFLPHAKRCTIVNRTLNGRVISLVEHLARSFPTVTFTTLTTNAPNKHHATPNHPLHTREKDLEDAVSSADVIICATPSTAPLFPSHWVKAGTHIVLVGSYKPHMCEVDSALVRRAQPLLVDSIEACLKEAGDLIQTGITRKNFKQFNVKEIGAEFPEKSVSGNGKIGELLL